MCPTVCHLWTVACQAPCPWDFPGMNTEVACCNLLQEIFLTQRWKPSLLSLLHWILFCWATGEAPFNSQLATMFQLVASPVTMKPEIAGSLWSIFPLLLFSHHQFYLISFLCQSEMLPLPVTVTEFWGISDSRPICMLNILILNDPDLPAIRLHLHLELLSVELHS